jgi:alpha-2-macroglobulin-like protein
MYWKENYESPYWYNAPIEMHALMIEMFNEFGSEKDVNELKIWLLKQKQTNHWPSTTSTVDAVYALSLGNKNIISKPNVNIIIGKENINLTVENTGPGLGYFKKNWRKNEISNDFGNIKVTSEQEHISWGAIYWQYFEDIDQIHGNKTSLLVEKKIYKKAMNENGIELIPIDETNLKLGDKVIVQLNVKTDRDLEFVHLKDMRASGFEPLNTLSGYKYTGGIGFYKSTKDVSQNFFFDRLPKGNYTFEYEEVVNQKGKYSSGIATIQCMYAPEFISNSKSFRVVVE